MIHTCLPQGTSHGWGVCGAYLTRELCKLNDGWVVPWPFAAGDNPEYGQSSPLFDRLLAGYPTVVDDPLLQAIEGHTLLPGKKNLWSRQKNVGYVFFENNLLVKEYAENAGRYFDHVVTGSSWCERALRDAGLMNVSTIIQGVDHDVFKPAPRTKHLDKFVIFSCGKFEYRKGIDIVIKAAAVMMERHKDVHLAALWHNAWPETMESMRQSKLITLPDGPMDPRFQPGLIYQVMIENGIPLDRVIPIKQPVPHGPELAEIMQNSDVGLFPSRCEGGTNLPLMESMACGLPCIATTGTGHGDVTSGAAPIEIGSPGSFTVHDGNMPIAEWPEPDVDEVISTLEWAYSNREDLRISGRFSLRDMQEFTWEAAAKKFIEVLK